MDTIITLTGNLGADPRLRLVGPEQLPVTEFNVAHTPRVRQGDQWTDGATTWYRITCWRKLAENVVASLRRGDAAIITGRLRPSEWVDKTGEVRRTEAVEAITVGTDLSRSKAHVLREHRSGARTDEIVPEGMAEAERIEREQLMADGGAGPDEAGRDEGAYAEVEYLAGTEPTTPGEEPVEDEDEYRQGAA